MVEEFVVPNSKEYWNIIYQKELDTHYSREDTERWKAIIPVIKNTDKILDFGCGLGEFVNWCVRIKPYCSYTGIDISPLAIDYCKKKMPNFNWFIGDSLSSSKEGDFDIIICQHVLEHMTEEKMEEFFDNAYNILPVNGILVVVMPINDAEWIEHIRIWQLNDIADMVRKKKDKWFGFAHWRSYTQYKRIDGHNDNDFEEAIIIFTKKEMI